MAGLANVLFNGIAYGMLLFIIAVGLSVTMGLMGFVNLAHGAFAMLGGYVTAQLMLKAGLPFLLTLPIAFLIAAVVGLLLERTLYRRLYRAGELDQVLLTIGIVFMAVAGTSYFFGTSQQPIRVPSWLTGQVSLAGLDFGVYRLFLIVTGSIITVALILGMERTRLGARIRAAVDSPRMAEGIGIDVSRVFSVTFAIGSGLAGLGGALGVNLVGLEPTFPLKYMTYFLIVVAVGGLGSIRGSFVAALLLGISDVAGKYYVPETGAFIIYAVMVGILLWRPRGLFGKDDRQTMNDIQGFFRRQAAWRWPEAVFWLALVACYFIFPGNLVLISRVLVLGLFALSLDLILGYGGIVSLGHAAFFGLGAYTAGLLTVHGWGEPVSGLLLAGAAAGLLGLATSFVVVRLHGIALLMVTMGIALVLHEIAQRARAITGGDDGLQGIAVGSVLGLFRFDLAGRTAFWYALIVVFLCFLLARHIVHSPFGLTLRALRERVQRLPAIGVSVGRASATIYTIAAVLAGIAGGLLMQTTQYVSVEVLDFERSAEVLIMLILGGAGRLYGGLIGAALFLVLRDRFADVSPQYWLFWIGLILVIVVLFARNGVLGALDAVTRRLRRSAP